MDLCPLILAMMLMFLRSCGLIISAYVYIPEAHEIYVEDRYQLSEQ